MTQTMKGTGWRQGTGWQQSAGWQRRSGLAALGALVAVAAVLGPSPLATRLGASDVVGYATVSAADTITSNAVLAEVAAAGRRGVLKTL
jgi:hypothetical protein